MWTFLTTFVASSHFRLSHCITLFNLFMFSILVLCRFRSLEVSSIESKVFVWFISFSTTKGEMAVGDKILHKRSKLLKVHVIILGIVCLTKDNVWQLFLFVNNVSVQDIIAPSRIVLESGGFTEVYVSVLIIWWSFAICPMLSIAEKSTLSRIFDVFEYESLWVEPDANPLDCGTFLSVKYLCRDFNSLNRFNRYFELFAASSFSI